MICDIKTSLQANRGHEGKLNESDVGACFAHSLTMKFDVAEETSSLPLKYFAP